MQSPLLLVVVLALMGLVSAALLRVVPSAGPLAAESSGPYRSLDGLRGLLAAAVLVHHACIARAYFNGAPWATPSSALYHFLGNGAVAIFFMITGLLFWGKAIDGGLRFGALLRSRVLRIMPLYLFSLLPIFTICIARSDPQASNTLADFVYSVLRWLPGGLLGAPPIEGVSALTVNAGVTWTLQYEWFFYLLLPALAWFAPPRRFVVLAAGYLLAAWLLRRLGVFEAMVPMLVALPFGGGMVAAYVVRSRAGAWQMNTPLITCFVLASVLIVVALYRPHRAAWLHLALVPAFTAVALGNDCFGLLSRRWVRWLGHISFSIYLLHGIVLLAALSLLNAHWPVAAWSDSLYVLVCGALAVVVVGLSTWTYLVIERSFIGPRSRAVRRMRGARTSRKPARRWTSVFGRSRRPPRGHQDFLTTFDTGWQ